MKRLTIHASKRTRHRISCQDYVHLYIGDNIYLCIGRQSRTLYLSVVPATNLRLSSFCNKISEPERGAIRRRRVLTLTAATTPSTTFTTVRSKTALRYRITNSL